MTLDVWLHDRRVGRLSEDRSGLSFAYSTEAMDEPARSRLSVRLPVRAEPYAHREAAAFFDNLLPEEDARAAIAQAARFSVSDTVALLGAVGGECAGAVSLWPEGMTPPAPAAEHYVPCARGDARILGDPLATAELVAELRGGRQSMSGAQQKLVLLRRGDAYWLPRAGSPTTVLVKRSRGRFPGLLQNEHFAMRLLAAAGTTIARAQPCALDDALYECLRYDRVDDGARVARLHQEDFCQATGRSPRAKYAASASR